MNECDMFCKSPRGINEEYLDSVGRFLVEILISIDFLFDF